MMMRMVIMSVSGPGAGTHKTHTGTALSSSMIKDCRGSHNYLRHIIEVSDKIRSAIYYLLFSIGNNRQNDDDAIFVC